jgi:S1-C subfamily serine protease
VILRSDTLRDAALLEIPAGGLPTVTLGDSTVPTSGTKIEVSGYPTLAMPIRKTSPGSASPAPATPAPLNLLELQLKTVDGSVDGETESGESILLNVAVTHGDSGAPVIDLADGHVVAMVLGLASGYGSVEWMSDDGLGLSVAGLQSILNPLVPVPTPSAPAFSLAMNPNPDAAVSTSWVQLGASAGFGPVMAATSATCKGPSGPEIANGVIDQVGDPADIELDVADCSGAPIYRDELDSDNNDEPNLIRLVDRDFLGFIDSHRAAWESFLRFGLFIDPSTNPYLALMSVERNPFGQLIVEHTFKGGPADLAGIRTGDAILKIDGRLTRSLGDQFIARLLNQPRVTLQLDRELHEFDVRLSLQRYSQITAAGPVPR